MEDSDRNDDNTALDTSEAERSVWLLKCPPLVSEAWKSAAAAGGDSTPVAKVVASLDLLRAGDPSALQYTMEMAGGESVLVPKSYALHMIKDFVPVCVFSESNQGRAAIEGKVDRKFDMKPRHKSLDDYGKMCRERTKKSMVKNRQTQVLNNDHGVHMRSMPGMMGFNTLSTSKDKKKVATPVKASDLKRTRRDRGDMEEIMFKLFESKPNWTLKQLVQETEQPVQFLKEIMNDLCAYNKRGTNQGTYELKPEYKKSVEDTGVE